LSKLQIVDAKEWKNCCFHWDFRKFAKKEVIRFTGIPMEELLLSPIMEGGF